MKVLNDNSIRLARIRNFQPLAVCAKLIWFGPVGYLFINAYMKLITVFSVFKVPL